MKNYKFCPKCAGELEYRKLETATHPVCTRCGFEFYENSKPTAGALIEDERGRVLLSKRKIDPRKGYWDILGGFLEKGEEPLEGLKREIREELQIEMKDIVFQEIYIDHYFDSSETKYYTLNIIFRAKIKSGEIKPNYEISELKWFSKDDLPWDKLAFPNQKQTLKNFFKK